MRCSIAVRRICERAGRADRRALGRVGVDVVESRQLLGGAGMGFGQTGDLVVVVVLELGGALDQRLARAERVALEHQPLRLDMASDAIHRVVDMGVEPRLEGRALAVVARLLERRAA